MKTVYKYPVSPGVNTVEIPIFAKFLHFGYQPQHGLHVWALVNSEIQTYKFVIRVIGTGWNADDLDLREFDFLGTCQTTDGLVFHAFVKGQDLK